MTVPHRSLYCNDQNSGLQHKRSAQPAYQVLNPGKGRAAVFHQNADYAAFRDLLNTANPPAARPDLWRPPDTPFHLVVAPTRQMRSVRPARCFTRCVRAMRFVSLQGLQATRLPISLWPHSEAAMFVLAAFAHVGSLVNGYQPSRSLVNVAGAPVDDSNLTPSPRPCRESPDQFFGFIMTTVA